jgi:ribonuclease III
MVFGRRPATALESRLGYRFKRPDLLELALTHRSWANEQGMPENYERLELLGDAVLGLVTAEWLYHNNPELPEGELAKRKAQLVSRPSLARYAQEIGLGQELRIGVGEDRSGGRNKASILEAALEAVFGAVFLDAGLDAARQVILPMLEGAGEEPAQMAQLLAADSKTQLQEVTQALGWELPDYRLTGESGPDHSKVFTIECWIAGELAGRGEGPSKKAAEQKAAAEALARVSHQSTQEP